MGTGAVIKLYLYAQNGNMKTVQKDSEIVLSRKLVCSTNYLLKKK